MATIPSNTDHSAMIEGFPATFFQRAAYEAYHQGSLDNVVVTLEWEAGIRGEDLRQAINAAVSHHPIFSTRITLPSPGSTLMQVLHEADIAVETHNEGTTFSSAINNRFSPDGHTSVRIHLLMGEADTCTHMALVAAPYQCDSDSLLMLLSPPPDNSELSFQHFSEWSIDTPPPARQREPDSIIDIKTSPASPAAVRTASHRADQYTDDISAITAAFACLVPYLAPNESDCLQITLSLNGRIFDEFHQMAGPFRAYLPLSVSTETSKSSGIKASIERAISVQEESVHLIPPDLKQPVHCLVEVIDAGSVAGLFSEATITVSSCRRAPVAATVLIYPAHSDINVFTELPDITEQDSQRLAQSIGNALKIAKTDEQASLTDIAGRQLPNVTAIALPPETLNDLYESAILRYADRVAFASLEQTITFSEIDQAVQGLAGALLAHGSPGDKVLLHTDRSLDAIVAVWAVLRAGMVSVPILPGHPDQRINDIAQRSGARLSIAQEDCIPLAQRTSPGLVLPALGHSNDTAVHVSRSPSDTAYIIFTSGSTGTPKGVAVAQRSVVNLLKGLDARIYGMSGHPMRVSLNAPLAFDASIKQVFQMLQGRTLVAVPAEVRRDPEALITFVHRQKIDTLDITPTLLQMMIERGFHPVDGYPGRILIGGEAMHPPLWDVVSAWSNCEVWNVYGPTEATVNTLVARVRDTSYPTLGRPLPEVQTAVVDEAGYELPIGAVGELQIAGISVAQGYVGAAPDEQRKFGTTSSGVATYRTGDLVRQLANGDYLYQGRRDDQVKLAGQRLELGEIQYCLEQHPSVQRAAVLLDTRDAIPRIVAAVVPQPSDTPLPASVARQVDTDMLYVTLPNGLNVASVNANETHYQYKEIFEDKIYTHRHLTYPSDAVVFDVGANIGMFSLFVSHYVPQARIFAFEPLQPIRERLMRNVATYAPNTTVLPYALSDQNGATTFTYYPGYSMMSSQAEYADAVAEKSVITQFLSNSVQHGDENASLLLDNIDELLEGRFNALTFECPLRRLSDVINEYDVTHIDILKIDVQRAELDVLNGIEDRHFDIIRSVALEVHDDPGSKTCGRIKLITSLLRDKGFEVLASQDELLTGTDRWNCVAWRPGAFDDVMHTVDFKHAVRQQAGVLSASVLQKALAVQLPAYMLPHTIAIIETLPVTAQGKLDRRTLLSEIDVKEQASSTTQPQTIETPSTSNQRETLLNIWRSVLRKPELNAQDDFFLNGGDSIRAIMMQSQARKAGIEVSLQALNTTATIAALLPATTSVVSTQDHSAQRATLLGIWQNVLRKPGLTEHDDFFLSGGDSIRAIMMQSQARKAGHAFTLNVLHDHPAFADFAAEILGGVAPVTSAITNSPAQQVVDGTSWLPSSLQHIMLLATLYRDDSVMYHNATTVAVHTPYVASDFLEALKTLRKAHPILAAHIKIDQGQMAFVFDHGHVGSPPNEIDLSALSEADAERAIRQHVQSERNRRFDLEEESLVRFTILIRSASRFDLLVAEHHAALDGMSLAAMVSELIQRIQGNVQITPPRDIDVFHALHHDVINASNSDASEHFWRRTFNEITPPSPIAPPRRRADKADMQQVNACVMPDADRLINAASMTLAASRKGILFALHVRALECTRGAHIHSVGAVYSLRPETEGSEQALGMFLNVLPVPVNGQSLADIAHAFDTFDRAVFPYKAVSQERLREWVAAHANIDSIFNFILFTQPDVHAGDIHETEQRYFAVDAYVPLAIDWDLSGDQLSVGFQYDRCRVDDAFAKTLCQALRDELNMFSQTFGATSDQTAAHVMRTFGLTPEDRHQRLESAGLNSIDQLRLAGALSRALTLPINPVHFMAANTVADLFAMLSPTPPNLSARLIELSAPQRTPTLRIIGFPLTGAAPSAFDPWCDCVPPGVAVHALQMPDLSLQDNIASMDTLVEAVLDALAALDDAPLVLVGCSFGAIIAYEAARQMERRPKALLAIGSSAPQPGFQVPAYHLMDDALIDEALREMRLMMSDALHDETQRSSVRAALRTVAKLAETYRPIGEQLMDCDVMSVWPRQDRTVTSHDMQSWALLTGAAYHALEVDGAHAMLIEDPMGLYEQSHMAQWIKQYCA